MPVYLCRIYRGPSFEYVFSFEELTQPSIQLEDAFVEALRLRERLDSRDGKPVLVHVTLNAGSIVSPIGYMEDLVEFYYLSTVDESERVRLESVIDWFNP